MIHGFDAGINLVDASEVLFGEYSQTSICDQDGNDIEGDGSFELEDDGVLVCSTSTATDISGFSCTPGACNDTADAGVEVCIK